MVIYQPHRTLCCLYVRLYDRNDHLIACPGGQIPLNSEVETHLLMNNHLPNCWVILILEIVHVPEKQMAHSVCVYMICNGL